MKNVFQNNLPHRVRHFEKLPLQLEHVGEVRRAREQLGRHLGSAGHEVSFFVCFSVRSADLYLSVCAGPQCDQIGRFFALWATF